MRQLSPRRRLRYLVPRLAHSPPCPTWSAYSSPTSTAIVRLCRALAPPGGGGSHPLRRAPLPGGVRSRADLLRHLPATPSPASSFGSTGITSTPSSQEPDPLTRGRAFPEAGACSRRARRTLFTEIVAREHLNEGMDPRWAEFSRTRPASTPARSELPCSGSPITPPPTGRTPNRYRGACC